MKIIVMGGAGDMGSRAVEDLSEQADIEQITIADKNIESAKAIANRLQGKKAKVDAKYVDALDHQSLVSAIKGYDVCASALGPFYIFEPKLVRASIEAGVNYASICDDWLAAEQVFKEFSEPARKKGVIILSGLGTSPGITNVGVRFFAQRMDKINRVDVQVYQPLNGGGGKAVIEHMVFIMSKQVPAWREGKQKMIPACSEEKTVEFPKFGPIKLWNMGHGEPVTVPKFFPEIKEVNFYMGYGSGANLLVIPAKLGLFNSDSGKRFFANLLHRLERISAPKEPEPGAVRIDVWGERAGKEVKEMACGTGKMRDATGLSLSVGTLMLGRKEILVEEGGVFAPEACLEPNKFLNYMKQRGVSAYFDLEMTKPVG